MPFAYIGAVKAAKGGARLQEATSLPPTLCDGCGGALRPFVRHCDYCGSPNLANPRKSGTSHVAKAGTRVFERPKGGPNART